MKRLALVIAGLFLVPGCTKPPDKLPVRPVLRVAIADSGAKANAVLPHLSQVAIQVVRVGQREVLEGLRQRDIDVGVLAADFAYVAYAGQLDPGVAPFEQLRGVAVVGLSPIHLITTAASVKSIADLRQLRVGLGGTRHLRLLQAFGLDLHDVKGVMGTTSGKAADLLAAGQLDAVFIDVDIDPPEAPGLVATKAGGRLIEIEGKAVDLMRLEYPFLVRALIPTGTYAGQRGPIRTVGIDLLFACRADLDSDLVYRFIDDYFSSLARTSLAIDFDRAAAMVIPLHAAAVRYYRERELSR